jgi:sugar phosphate isomerase/epimerase
VSLCRGGFFVSPTVEGRAEAIEENKLIIREAVELGAPLLVLVCGANPAVPLDEARKQIRNGIEKVLPLAEELNIKLAIEPLHPMYAETRSAITYLFTANQICKAIDSPFLGVAVDVYHLWFDPKLENEIKNAGKKIFAFHVSDWSTPRLDVLNDRRIMGEGCIEIPRVRSWVEEAGFKGFIEVEIFSKEYWATDQRVYIKKIVEAYRAYV